jgi:hypothetical protein
MTVARRPLTPAFYRDVEEGALPFSRLREKVAGEARRMRARTP